MIASGPFRAIDYEFTVLSDDVDLAAAVSSTFEHCAAPDGDVGRQIRILVGDTQAEWLVDGETRHVDNIRLLSNVVSSVNLAAAQQRRDDFPVLHAGGVSLDGKALVFAGSSGSGKSTTVGSLLQRGAQYVSDELIAVRSVDELQGYPKAITLKEGSWAALGMERPAPGRFETTISYVPPEVFNNLDPLQQTAPSGLVFPTFDPAQPSASRGLTPGEATTRLAKCAYLPLTQAGFETLAELSAAVPAFETIYPTTADAVQLVHDIMEEDDTPRDQSVEIGRAEQGGDVVDGTSWADFGTELVAANATTNNVVHLDGEGRAMWLGLARGEAMASGLRSELVQLGLVHWDQQH